MNYFYLYIFLLFCFIITVSYYNTYANTYTESFNSSNQSIVLLGDSILKNDAYVSNGKSIHNILNERTNGQIYCYAMDDSKINQIYNQFDNIPENLNNKHTTIFLSAGGNDILSHYVEQYQDTSDTSILKDMFASYTNLVDTIRNKMNNAKLVLLDIYYPNNLKYKQYHPIINEWNNMIYSYASDIKNNINVFKTSSMLMKDTDFSLGIEPSSSGGEKIAENILNYY